MISFDQILEEKIGSGIYQLRTVSIIGLIEFCDGVEYVFMSILMAILQKEWQLSQTQVATLGSSFLGGVVIGNCICAYITDKIGRKTSFSIFAGLSVILVYYTSFAQSYNEIIILRLLFGIVFGTTSPLGYVFITEVAVAKYRGRFAFSLTLMYVAGKAYLIFLCFFFLDDYTSGNWRGLIRFNGIPVLLCFILSILYLKETIRYYLNKGQYTVAFQEIEEVQKQNNSSKEALNESEKDGLIAWQLRQNNLMIKENLNEENGVLSKQHLRITLQLWTLLILANFQNLSIYLLMPFLFAQENSGFEHMLYLFLIEFVFAFVIYLFIDDPKYGGRVNIIIYASILLVITNLLLYIYQASFLFVGMLLIKIATRGMFSTLFIICCESYPLHLRSRGSGLAMAVGKVVSIPSPYVLFPLFAIDPYLPFLILSVLGTLMIALSITYPSDRTQKHLEIYSDEQKEE
ncbi:unnamed protein product [Paramecium octaurelia]|uniref:Major facilitator superfamily (MFS) profile domain-containing protein n=1 Tax=Paramecium octaurelia TaxID=43137 RepID=A0A8S1SWS1_PAROT|nr:unnamed protein product [Paramecium octaurelia]